MPRLQMRAYLDTETGGKNPLKHSLLQIGIYEPQSRTKESWYVQPYPGLVCSEEASGVNGWPDSHVGKEILSEAEAINKLIKFCSGFGLTQLVAHNAPFDYMFTRCALARQGQDMDSIPRFFCTMDGAERLKKAGGFPPKSLSLDSCLKELAPDYNRPEIHDAAEDAFACYLVDQGIDDRFQKMAALANTASSQQLQAAARQQPQRRVGFGRIR
jgi:DNA polymerase III epsilon subunit-like protein